MPFAIETSPEGVRIILVAETEAEQRAVTQINELEPSEMFHIITFPGPGAKVVLYSSEAGKRRRAEERRAMVVAHSVD